MNDPTIRVLRIIQGAMHVTQAVCAAIDTICDLLILVIKKRKKDGE